MWRWIVRRWLTLRTWVQVRVGLARGRWQRGAARPAAALFMPTVPLGRWPVQAWRFGLYCPVGLRDDDEAPLIVLLHGCHQSALRFAVATGWTGFADRARIRLLCPDQRRRANPLGCWNWFLLPAQRGGGELNVALAAIDDVSRRVAVRADNVAAVGLSAGGAMAALLAFHHPQRIRAAVAVAALPLLGPLNMQDPRDVMKSGLIVPPAVALTTLAPCAPIAVIHGDSDEVVAPVCGRQLTEQVIASHRGEEVQSSASSGNGTEVVDYRVDARLVARYITVAGLGHEWRGGPGGHAYCEPKGPPLVAMSARFLGAVGILPTA